jgi:hypothetical protein
VSVACGDLDADGYADLAAGAGPGGGPHVNVFSGKDGATLLSFFAFDAAFTGGVSVAVGDVVGLGHPQVVTGAGPGGGPHVKVFDEVTGQMVQSFMAFDPNFHGGVTVATAADPAGGPDILITAPGPGGGPNVKEFNAVTLVVLDSFYAYDPFFLDGLAFGVGFGLPLAFFPGYDPFLPVGLEGLLYPDAFFAPEPVFVDPGFFDPGFFDPGFFDPGFVDVGGDFGGDF